MSRAKRHRGGETVVGTVDHRPHPPNVLWDLRWKVACLRAEIYLWEHSIDPGAVPLLVETLRDYFLKIDKQAPHDDVPC